MTIPETQREAYADITLDLPEKRKAVFDMIAGHPEGLTLIQISESLRWPINCVSGRVTELRQVGWIKDSGKTRVNPASGKKGIVWLTVSYPEHIAITFDQSGQGAFA